MPLRLAPFFDVVLQALLELAAETLAFGAADDEPIHNRRAANTTVTMVSPQVFVLVIAIADRIGPATQILSLS